MTARQRIEEALAGSVRTVAAASRSRLPLMRRFRSIDLKFPMIMSGLVLATAILFVGVAYAQFAANLYATSGERLRTVGLLIANMVGEGAPRMRAQAKAVTTDPRVIEFLEVGGERDGAVRAIQRVGTGNDSTGRQIQLLDRNGVERLSVAISAITVPDWARKQLAAGTRITDPVSMSPIIDHGGVPKYQVVAPVRRAGAAGSDSGAIVGYLVDTRVVAGRGRDAIQDLIGEGTAFVLGTPGGAWTDLTKIVAAPPPGARADTVLVFEGSARGSGVGIMQPVRGTPWAVWLEQPEDMILAPVREFVREIIPSAALIALLGALLVWLFSRGITRRIVALTHQVDRLEAFDGAAIAVAGGGFDEIDRLDRAFERMEKRLERQRELEAQLGQSQKLEAVGRLAGGIAHDFNNILTVVRNYGDLVLEELPPDGEMARDMNALLHATGRASDLTRQLLAFSRHQAMEPRLLDLNEAIKASERLLQRLIPANVELVTTLDEDAGLIMADHGHIEQVMLNLTINAVDAMSAGGRITVRTQRVVLDDTFATGHTGDFSAAPPGPHASMIFSDTGSGMDRETASRIFDPFFTTKPFGKGTGLGLATVHGIITQNNGRIWVYSEPGRGTTFKIYFPIVEADGLEAAAIPHAPEVSFAEDGNATILVAEDDEAARGVIDRLLTKHGYSVIAVPNGVEALGLLNAERSIDLVLTDVMMPEMNGSELSDRLALLRPDLPVVLMSGYAEADIRSGTSALARPFIDKPFTAAALLAIVRNNLNADVGA